MSRSGKRRRRQGGRRGGNQSGQKNLIKAVRRACEAADRRAVQQAIADVHRSNTPLDTTTLQQLLHGLVKLGMIQEARDTLDQSGGRDAHLSPLGLLQILHSLPSTLRIDPAAGADLVDALVACSTFLGGPVAASYFRTRARWAVLEFLTEAASILEAIERQDPLSLARAGRAVIGARCEPGTKAGEVKLLGGSDGGGCARRGLLTGDMVRIALMHRAPPNQQLHGHCAVGDSGFEGEVIMERPLIVNLVGKGAARSTLMDRVRRSDGMLRVDKLANRVSYSREIAAITTLTSLPTDAVASGAAPKEVQTLKNNPRPSGVIARALAESCFGRLAPEELSALCAASPNSLAALHAVPMGVGAMAQGLNGSQRRALAAAAARSLTLVQGPPGTGKTAVAVRILTMWARSTNRVGGGALLACSDSNVAVDNMPVTLHGFVCADLPSVHPTTK